MQGSNKIKAACSSAYFALFGQRKRLKFTGAYAIAASGAAIGIFYSDVYASFVFYRLQNLTAAVLQALLAAGAITLSYVNNFASPACMAVNAACQPKHDERAKYAV
jgi:hypothetical protein